MLFIHQQIQSFLNLGACKEYPIMAKPKAPKKTNGVSAPVPPTAATLPASDSSVTAAEASAAVLSGSPTLEVRKTEPKKAARKPDVAKAESRANLLPINLEDEIRRLAYLFSERRGFEAGHETEDWVNAEREVRQRYHQHSASASA